MKEFHSLILLAVLLLGLGLLFSCSSSGSSGHGGKSIDDDSGSNDDDTSGDDDDDTGGDDDGVPGDTWTDPTSGLTWQVIPSSDYMYWDDAIAYCDNLSLDGGGWHLPTISELRTLIRGCDGTVTGGSCGVTDSCLDSSCQNESCYSCNNGYGPNKGCYGPSELPGDCYWYWSSSPVADDDNYAWDVYFHNGDVYSYDDYDYDNLARCVR